MLTIDRIEEGIAVCEKGDGSFVRLPARPGWAEGDVLTESGGGYAVDEAETRARREAARRKSRKIKGRRR